MKIEDRIIALLKELNIDSCSMFLNIEYLDNKLFITDCYTYHKPNKDTKLNDLIKELILENYIFNYEFKTALFVIVDTKEIKIEFNHPYICYRRVNDVIKLK